jgi:hypothetical protein
MFSRMTTPSAVEHLMNLAIVLSPVGRLPSGHASGNAARQREAVWRIWP